MPETSEPTYPLNPLWTKKFLLLIAANFSVYISFYMLIPSLPIYIKEITGKEALSGSAMGIFFLAAVLFRPFAGRNTDNLQRKGVFLFGLAIFFVSALALIRTPTLLTLLLARFVQGFGWAYCNTAAGTLASDIIPKPRFAEGMGYYGFSLSVAMGIGPALGLYLMQGYNFQLMFYVCAGFVLLSFLLAIFIKHNNSRSPEKNQNKPQNRPIAVKTVLLEKKALRPSLVIFFLSINYAAIISFLAVYGQFRQVPDIGIFFLVYAISITISRPLFGRLADRKGYDIVIVPGLILCTLTLVILYVAQTLPVFILAGIIYGIGFGAVQPTTHALSVLYVPLERRGAATATYFMFLDLGLALGSILWGVVAKAVGYDVMYLLVILPTLVSLLVYLLFARKTKMQHDNFGSLIEKNKST
ncbi:MFS transporter [Desulfosporosinus burensis]